MDTVRVLLNQIMINAPYVINRNLLDDLGDRVNPRMYRCYFEYDKYSLFGDIQIKDSTNIKDTTYSLCGFFLGYSKML